MKRVILATILSVLVVGAYVWIIVTYSDTSHKNPAVSTPTSAESATPADSIPDVSSILPGSTEAAAPKPLTDITHGTIEEGHVDLTLDLINQYPELPSGCEVVSLTMVLNYYGYNLDKTYLAENYLVYSDNFMAGYTGSPWVDGGCLAPAITMTANNFLADNGRKYSAVNTSGTDVRKLFDYLDEGVPVLVWCTLELAPRQYGYSAMYQGKEYVWDYFEHCVVLSGYDRAANTLTVYDPIYGITTYDIDRFAEIFDDFYRQSVVLVLN